MDGVSLLPSLTGKGVQQEPTIYIEYKGENKTPDYPVFSESHRGRIRNQTQLLRIGNYVGVRYDVKSAADDFEIYNVITDPVERNNLAGQDSMRALQQLLKQRVLELHHNGEGSPRPYDNEPVPALSKTVVPGVDWAVYKGPFPWIPQVAGLTPEAKGHTAIPSLTDTALNRVTVFSGFISVPADGEYRFYLTADTKAFLRIHDIQVIDADYGYPGGLPREATIVLKKGLHPFRLSYHRDQDQGEPFLKLDWSGPGMDRKKMSAANFFRENK
jgi:hypothetical protein